MDNKIKIFQYIDDPVKYGVLTVAEIGAIMFSAIAGFIFIGAPGMIGGGGLGFLVVSFYSKKNKKGFVKKLAYFFFPSISWQYKGIPQSHKRYFL